MNTETEAVFVKNWNAFESEWQELRKTHPNQWVAYVDGVRFGEPSATAECMGEICHDANVDSDKLYIAKVEALSPRAQRRASLESSIAAFKSDLPALLVEHEGKWAAYVEGRRVALAPTKTGAIEISNGASSHFANGRTFVTKIEPLMETVLEKNQWAVG